MKLNSDGSVDLATHYALHGGIIRDHKGNMVVSIDGPTLCGLGAVAPGPIQEGLKVAWAIWFVPNFIQ